MKFGRGDEFADYEVSTKEDAIDSGLDVLHLYDVKITYNGRSDEDLGHELTIAKEKIGDKSPIDGGTI